MNQVIEAFPLIKILNEAKLCGFLFLIKENKLIRE